MPKIIIHPTDFSDCAENALDYAVDIAKAIKAKIKLVHTLDYSEIRVTSLDGQALVENSKDLEENAKNKLLEIGKKVQDEGVLCEASIHTGRIGNWLPSYSEKESVEFIVMGTVGSDSLKNKVMGSNTFEIIKKTKTPVFCVPQEAKKEKFDNFLYLQDDSTKDRKQLALIAKLASSTKSEVNVVHFVIGKDESGIARFEELKKEIQTNVSDRIQFELEEANDLEEAIQSKVKRSNPDLLVLVMRHQNFFQRFFQGSLTESLVNHSNTPLLVFAD